MLIEKTDPAQVRIGSQDGHVIIIVDNRSVALDPTTAERLAAGLLEAIEHVSGRRYWLLGGTDGPTAGEGPSSN